MSDVSRIDTYGAKLVLLPYMLAIIGSCLYTIILGVYNGDFIQRDVLFPLPALLVIAVLTIIPYIGIYGLYKRYRSKETENVPDKFKVAIIRNITWLLLLVHIGLLFTGNFDRNRRRIFFLYPFGFLQVDGTSMGYCLFADFQ